MSCSFAGSWRAGKIVGYLGTSFFTLTLHLQLHLHSWRVFQPWAYLLGCWAMRVLCTGCPGDSANCSGDCPWRWPSSVHHHRPNLGRCDAASSCRHHCTITTRFGVPLALPHCTAPSHHQHVDAVNSTTPLRRPNIAQQMQGCIVIHCPARTAAKCIPCPSLVDDLPSASHFLACV